MKSIRNHIVQSGNGLPSPRTGLSLPTPYFRKKKFKFETLYRMGMDFPVLGPGYPSPHRTLEENFEKFEKTILKEKF